MIIFECLVDCAGKGGSDQQVISPCIPAFLHEVDDPHGRHDQARCTLRQSMQFGNTSTCCIPPAFKGRSSGSKEHWAPGQLASTDCRVATVVPRGGFLLVGTVVFLVDDDESKSVGGNGSKDGAPGTEDDVGFTSSGQGPLLVSLRVGEGRMKHCYTMFREASDESPAGLWCQGDLGYEQEDDPALSKHLFDEPDVDLGLS